LNSETRFLELSELCERLEATSSRISLVNLVADFLRKLKTFEVESAVRLIIGYAMPNWDPRVLEVGFATLIEAIQKITGATYKEFLNAFNQTGDVGTSTKILMEQMQLKRQSTLSQKPLTISNVTKAIEAIAEAIGPKSRIKKKRLIETLLSQASALEAKYLIKVLGGEMRHGFSEGLMEEAIATAFNVDATLVRRANLLISDLGLVAKISLNEGNAGLEKIKITLFHPIKPMLAESVQNVDEVFKAHNGASSLEYKPDGARVQIHKHGEHVRVFSRRLTDVTQSLPDIVDLVKQNLHADEAIIEGEAIAVGVDGKPKPFQYLMRRFRRVKEIEETLKEVPVQLQLFDIVYLDGRQLIDLPYSVRRRKLAEICGKILLTKQIFASNMKVAQEFFEGALANGYEGLIAKEPNSPYTPGVRGKKWLKLKRVPDTLDLVVVAADYGYGYRYAWLSDYYLAARNLETNKYEIVGKCFTGLTDDEIQWMTQQLNEIKLSHQGRTATVVPKIVLEIAFTEIQRSPTYRSGYALRFARIVRIRDDKAPQDVDTVQRIAEMFERQFSAKVS